MPNNITYDQTDTRVNGTTEEVFDRLGKELTEEKFKLRQNSKTIDGKLWFIISCNSNI